MNLRPDDPKLSAWLLGELSAAEAEEVERAVAADPALKLATHEMERVLKLLSNTLAPQQVELFPRQRNLILQEARRLDGSAQVLPFPVPAKARPSWVFPIAAAAMVTFACWLLVKLPDGNSPRVANQPTNADSKAGYWPTPAPSDGGSTTVLTPAAKSMDAHPNFPVLIPRGAIQSADHPALKLPVASGTKSLDWVRDAVRVENRLPHPHAVRFEEILNHFPLRPAGSAALAKGVALSTETMACPWNPSAQLLVVSLRGAPADDRDVSMAFHANAAVVPSYRLLGYAQAEGAVQATPPGKVKAGSAHSLVIELQASSGAGPFGSIQWSVDEEPASTLELVRAPDAVPSEDARFAALVAAGSLWLADRNSAVDSVILSALIREIRPSARTPERADFIRLLEQAMELATK